MYIDNFTSQLTKFIVATVSKRCSITDKCLCGTQNDDILKAVPSPDKYLCDAINSAVTTLKL